MRQARWEPWGTLMHPIPAGPFHQCDATKWNDMLLYSVLIFAIAAVGGVVLASSVLRGKLAPWTISLLHALLGDSGLILLILVVLQGSAPGRLTAALGLLVVAALGGFFLASFHLRKQVAPKAV